MSCCSATWSVVSVRDLTPRDTESLPGTAEWHAARLLADGLKP
jgi:hypothetical protein